MDISQFEGHSPGPWDDEYGPCFSEHEDDADVLTIKTEPAFDSEKTWVNQRLAASAPELLEEVKRLRAEIAGIDALVLETYEYVQNTVAPFGWESYLMKRFNLIAEHLGLLKNASE